MIENNQPNNPMESGADRDAKGRFSRGNRLGGRKPMATERRFLECLHENVSESEWGAIVRKAVELAKGGDHKARAWLSTYLIDMSVEERLQRLEELIAESSSHRSPYGF